MNCPKCDSEMVVYDKGLMADKYMCKGCGEKLEKNTVTGEVIAITGALVGIAAAIFGLTR